MDLVLNNRALPVLNSAPDGAVPFRRTLTRALVIALRPYRTVTVDHDSWNQISVVGDGPNPNDVPYQGDDVQASDLLQVSILSGTLNGRASHNLVPTLRNQEVILQQLSLTHEL